jgi:hypothetical protein
MLAIVATALAARPTAKDASPASIIPVPTTSRPSDAPPVKGAKATPAVSSSAPVAMSPYPAAVAQKDTLAAVLATFRTCDDDDQAGGM